MVSQKVVTPVETGVQKFCNQLKKIGFRLQFTPQKCGTGMTRNGVF